MRSSQFFLKGLGLIDEHDRNVVLYGVDQAASLANQLLSGLCLILEFPLALGANQDLQEFLRDAHGALIPVRVGPFDEDGAAISSTWEVP